MDTGFGHRTANDNEPVDRFPRGDAAGYRSYLREQQIAYYHQGSAHIAMELKDEVKSSSVSLSLALVCWLAAGTAFAWSFYTSQPIGMRLISAIALIWTALWSTYLAQDQYKPRLAEIAILTALIGFLGTLLTAATQLGLPLQTAAGFGLFSATSLIVAALIHSRTALIASISASLCWAALQFDGYMTFSPVLLALPAIWSGQILIAARLDSRTSIFAAVMCGYVWLGGFAYQAYMQGWLSPMYGLSAAFVIFTAHYHSAKAAEDEGLDSMPLHLLFAWGSAGLSLSAFQFSLLYPDNPFWTGAVTMSPFAKLAWLAVILLGLGMLALAGLVRRRHGRMTIGSTAALLIIHSLIPIAVWFEAQSLSYITAIVDTAPRYSAGLFIGGLLMGSAFMFAVNNLRRERYILVAAGLGVIALQSELALAAQWLSAEYMLLTLAGFVTAPTIMINLAQAQFTPSIVQRRLQSLTR